MIMLHSCLQNSTQYNLINFDCDRDYLVLVPPPLILSRFPHPHAQEHFAYLKCRNQNILERA